MSKLNGIFDSGMSGILESKRTTPEWLDKVAEENTELKTSEVLAENIEFNKIDKLSRAKEVSDDSSRPVENRIALSEISLEKEVEKLLSKGLSPQNIQETLERKFPVEDVKQFFESNKKFILNKYGQLGFIYLDKNLYENCSSIKAALVSSIKTGKKFISKLKVVDASCNGCTKNSRGFCLLTNLKITDDPQISTKAEAHALLSKFADSNIVNSAIVKSFIERLEKESVVTVVSAFLTNVKANVNLIKQSKVDVESDFKRDLNQKQSDERKIDNNADKNAKIESEFKTRLAFIDFKKYIQSGLTQKEAHQKLLQTYNPIIIKNFCNKHANEIKRFVSFFNREEDDIVTHLSNVEAPLDLNRLNSKVNYDGNKMLNLALRMMSSGANLNNVYASLDTLFGVENLETFKKKNENTLRKVYGQLGYVYLDSNVYGTCDEMKEEFDNMKHIGKHTLFSLKANHRCKNCVCNISGKCQKTNGLMISNSPLVRSPRAAKRVFNRLASFVSKDYIEKFASQVQETGNNKLISQFMLGLCKKNRFNFLKEVISKKYEFSKTANKNVVDNDVYTAFANFNMNTDINWTKKI